LSGPANVTVRVSPRRVASADFLSVTFPDDDGNPVATLGLVRLGDNNLGGMACMLVQLARRIALHEVSKPFALGKTISG
jgi:hypothetical protein